MKQRLYSILVLFCVIIAFLLQVVKYVVFIPIIVILGIGLAIMYKTVELITNPTFLYGLTVIVAATSAMIALSISLATANVVWFIVWLINFTLWLRSYTHPEKVSTAIQQTIYVHLAATPFYMWNVSMYPETYFTTITFIFCMGLFALVLANASKIANRFTLTFIH